MVMEKNGYMLSVLQLIMGTLFFYLGVVLARHCFRKLKWRKDKGKKQGTVTLTDSKTQSQSAKPDIKLNIKSHSTNSNNRDETRSESNPISPPTLTLVVSDA